MSQLACLQPGASSPEGVAMGFLSSAAAVGMAIGPPLVYVDQLRTILKRKDSSGFAHDVCGVLILSSIARIYFWFNEVSRLLYSPPDMSRDSS